MTELELEESSEASRSSSTLDQTIHLLEETVHENQRLQKQLHDQLRRNAHLQARIARLLQGNKETTTKEQPATMRDKFFGSTAVWWRWFFMGLQTVTVVGGGMVLYHVYTTTARAALCAELSASKCAQSATKSALSATAANAQAIHAHELARRATEAAWASHYNAKFVERTVARVFGRAQRTVPGRPEMIRPAVVEIPAATSSSIGGSNGESDRRPFMCSGRHGDHVWMSLEVVKVGTAVAVPLLVAALLGF